MQPPRDLGTEADLSTGDSGMGGDGGGTMSDPSGTIDSPAGDLVIAVGDSISFGASCVDPDSDLPLSHSWSFDGGALDSSLEDPGVVTFETPGVFQVVYTCMDASGASDSTPPTRRVEVVAPSLVPLMGDVVSDGRFEVFFVDPEASSPAAIDPIPGGWPAHASVDPSLPFQTRLSPDGRFASFIADIAIDGEPALYVVDTSSPAGAAVKVSDIGTGGRVVEYEWSPDSSAVAFFGDDGSGGRSVWIADLSAGLATATVSEVGTGLTSIKIRSTRWPRWSRDSTKYLFRAREGASGPLEGYLFDRANPGLGQQRIHPALAPGAIAGVEDLLVVADTAVLIGDLDDDLGVDIYAIELSGSFPGTAHRLTTANATFDNGVSTQRLFYGLSPSGNELIFPWLGATSVTPARPYLVDLSGGATGAAGSALAFTLGGDPTQRVVDYEWSPDELSVAIGVPQTSGNDMVLIYYRSALGMSFGSWSQRTALRTPPLVIEEFGWSPDGAWVLMLDDRDSPGVLQLTGRGYLAGDFESRDVLNAPLVTGGEVEGLGRFASSTQLVYVADAEVDGVNEVYAVDPNTPGAVTKISPAVTASPPDVGFSDSRLRVLPSGDVVAAGDWRIAGVVEPVLLDPSGGSATPLLPPLSSGLGIRWIPMPDLP